MPKFGSSDIPHSSGSDHRILRNPREKQNIAGQPHQRVRWSLFDDSDQRMPEWEVQRARALALSDQAMQESDPLLMRQAVVELEAVVARDFNDLDALSKLCYFYNNTRNYSKANSVFEAALRIDPQHEMSLKNYGILALQTGSFDTARRCFESYLKVNQWDGTMYGPYAATLANLGNLPAAVQAAERGLELDPTQKRLHGLAAQLYARIGDKTKSLRHRELLQQITSQLDPWDQKRADQKTGKIQESHEENR